MNNYQKSLIKKIRDLVGDKDFYNENITDDDIELSNEFFGDIFIINKNGIWDSKYDVNTHSFIKNHCIPFENLNTRALEIIFYELNNKGVLR